MELWSTIFTDSTDWATCILPVHAWRRVTDDNEGSRLIAKITVGEQTIYAALGTPVQEDDTAKLYLPTWMLDQLGVVGEGKNAEVSWLSEEAFPEATRIVLRPHDSAFYHADAKEELERALTQLGILRQGDTLVIPLACLGGFEVVFDVVVTEPANIVLAHGDEVAIEFEGALDAIETPEMRPDTPRPESPELFEEILPAPQIIPGQQLGGQARLMPDGRRWNPWRDGPMA